jgi:phosphatidylglycerophosphate synthase
MIVSRLVAERLTTVELVQDRRPLKSRQRRWAHRLAHLFVVAGVSPNQMSSASMVVALLGGSAYIGTVVATPLVSRLLFMAAAICVQLRLLSNLIDGLMAIEEGKKTATGALFNEFPDRISDTLFLVGAGYAAGSPELGWAAALLAVLTAYVRALGASLGFGQDYSGPMAKQQRMFVLTVGSVVAVVLPQQAVLLAAVAIIAVGSAATVLRRSCRLAARLTDTQD